MNVAPTISNVAYNLHHCHPDNDRLVIIQDLGSSVDLRDPTIRTLTVGARYLNGRWVGETTGARYQLSEFSSGAIWFESPLPDAQGRGIPGTDVQPTTGQAVRVAAETWGRVRQRLLDLLTAGEGLQARQRGKEQVVEATDSARLLALWGELGRAEGELQAAVRADRS